MFESDKLVEYLAQWHGVIMSDCTADFQGHTERCPVQVLLCRLGRSGALRRWLDLECGIVGPTRMFRTDYSLCLRRSLNFFFQINRDASALPIL